MRTGATVLCDRFSGAAARRSHPASRSPLPAAVAYDLVTRATHEAIPMSTTVKVRDESTAGGSLHEFALEILTERISVRELIRSRVYQEVQDYNQKQPEIFRGLVQPTDAEVTQNGFKLKKRRSIDWKKQFDKAIEAFESNRILILVDNKQVDSLDQEIEVKPGTEVSFLRLTMLVGG
jgi:hypothetical protein